MKIFNKCLNHKIDFDNITMNSCDSSIASVCKSCGEEISVPILYSVVYNRWGVDNYTMNYLSGTDKKDAEIEVVYADRMMSNSEREQQRNDKNDWYDRQTKKYEDGGEYKLSKYYVAI